MQLEVNKIRNVIFTPEPVQSLAYILIPSIPVLLLLMVITAIFCFWIFAKRQVTLFCNK